MLKTIWMAGALTALAAGCYHPNMARPSTDGTTYVSSHGMVPAGTLLWARIDATGLDGGRVQASSIADVRSADGEEVLIPAGAVLDGRVVDSDGLHETVTFQTIEMGGTAQRLDAEIVTGDGSGLTNLMQGTKIQVRLRQPIPSLAAVRRPAYY